MEMQNTIQQRDGTPDIRRIFERKEKKYLLTKQAYEKLYPALLPHMIPDRHGESTVLSIYYDNDAYDLITRSIEKPLYKEKLRIRSYGVPDDGTAVFAEIKKKYDGTVYKRRIAAPCAQMMDFLENGTPLPGSLQIQREIRYMISRKGLRPKVFLACSRTALLGRDDPGLRITFDTDLRYRTEMLDLRAGDSGTPFYKQGAYIMEIKTQGGMPRWLSDLLSSQQIYPGSFSKVGTAFQEKIYRNTGR